MKKIIQVTALALILAGAAFVGYKYPALHPENNLSIYSAGHSTIDTVKTTDAAKK